MKKESETKILELMGYLAGHYYIKKVYSFMHWAEKHDRKLFVQIGSYCFLKKPIEELEND